MKGCDRGTNKVSFRTIELCNDEATNLLYDCSVGQFSDVDVLILNTLNLTMYKCVLQYVCIRVSFQLHLISVKLNERLSRMSNGEERC